MDLATMTRACAATGDVVAAVGADQHDLPTPCTEWTVRDLLNHLVGTLVLGRALLADAPPGPGAAAPGGLPPGDVLGDDPLAAYRTGAAALLAAAAGDALSRPHATPLGELPGTVLAGFTTLDIAVHGWDLARATGQDAILDAAVAAPVLAFARQALSDDMRAPRIGPAVPVAGTAGVTDQLVAFLGRTP